MKYIVARIQNKEVRKQTNDILIAYLNEIGYEAFEEHIEGVDAYIPLDNFNEEDLKQLRKNVDTLDFEYEWEILEEKNWNKEWEDNYKPIIIEDKLYIRSTFHNPKPSISEEIIINPQMSFGTGHHETTTLMLKALLNIDLAGKRVLDVGCGTGILAIYAAKNNATVFGVDIDENAYNNAKENIALNLSNNAINLVKGTINDVSESEFDIILANINRNVLIHDMNKYADKLKKNGTLLLSGFYSSDIPIINESITASGLKICNTFEQNDWVLLKLTKN